MQPFTLRPVMLGNSGFGNTSVFSPDLRNPFTMSGPPRLAQGPAQRPGPMLGQVDQEWFTRAKAAVARYDELVIRASSIARKDYREDLIRNFNSKPTDSSSALYRRNTVAFNVSEAEAFSPVNYLVFSQSQVKNRVSKLEEWNRDFRNAVKQGEELYGSLPEPVIVTIRQEIPWWIAPVVVGAASLALLSALGVFK